MALDNFRTFEANLRSNQGLNPEYINRIEREERAEAQRKLQSREVESPMSILPMAIELSRLHGSNLHMTQFGPIPEWFDRDKKAKIEELANEIIMGQYGSIIDSMNIEMDMKLVDPDELQNKKQEMGEEGEEPKYEESDDETLKDDVDKRKLVNVITQGSAKNTHRLIHLHKDKIDEVDESIFPLMDRLIKSQEAAEWLAPNMPDPGQMIVQQMNGYSDVSYESEEDEEEVEERTQEIDVEALLNNDEEETQELEENFEDFSGKIKVVARGLDLVILLHEAVKGIYEVLGAPSIPEFDTTRAENILANTDNPDNEFEDLKFGPRIRKDLLDWVNSNPKSRDLDDSFEYVWGAMVQMNSRKFLALFKDIIINKSGRADRWLDETLTDIINDMEQYQKDLYKWEEDNADADDFSEEIEDQDVIDQEEAEINTGEDWKNVQSEEEENDDDLSNWSTSELNKALDDALDKGDMDTVKIIGAELSKR
jgi:hypothetical protein